MLIAPDKISHFLAGGFIAALVWPFGVWLAVIAVLVAAVGKEVYDKLHPDKHTVDIWDAIATVMGGFLMLGWLELV